MQCRSGIAAMRIRYRDKIDRKWRRLGDMSYKSKSISSKLTKNGWLLKHSRLQSYLPPMKPFNKRNLTAMLNRYSVVYFKPTTGSGGNHITRIRKQAQGFRARSRSKNTFHSSIDSLFRQLNKQASLRPYLLQKGIQLAAANGKPFDIRVMVQKTNKGKWISTALFTKIGKPGVVATNYNQGGKIGFIRPTLSRAGYTADQCSRMEFKLKQMGADVGGCFDQHLRGFRELGLDVALDAARRPWILEVNTRPQFYPLKDMKDKSLYRRIVSYAKQYGRRK